MSSRSRSVRSDVPTRSTGYQEEVARRTTDRVRDAVAPSSAESDRSEIEARRTDAPTRTDTPLLDEAAEQEVAPTTEVARDETRDQEVSEEAPATEVAQEQQVERTPDQLYTDEEAQKLGMWREKTVSAEAMKRLVAAKNAINHTKQVLEFGGGNQFEALKDSNFNSYFRMAAMRDPECWEMHPGIRQLAAKYPDALTAAKADLAQGGNCGEHAQVAFDYLRQFFSGDVVNRCDVAGLDHAFIIIGNVMGEDDADLAVSDPWPTSPTACMWMDHFAYKSDKSKINIRATAQNDPAAVKEALAKGIRLSAKGKAMLEAKFDDERTEKELEKGTDSSSGKNWIWQHADSASGGPINYNTGGNS